jgi:hypothetical protein
VLGVVEDEARRLWMGVARAPVTGSGWAPAWMARVPKPKARSAPEGVSSRMVFFE